MLKPLRSFPAMIACISLVASPVMAADLPVGQPEVQVAPTAKPWDGQTASDHRRYRRYRPYRHRNRVDAGDVLAGVLIIGGIAAIAGAASKDRGEQDRDYRYRDRDYRDRDYRYRDYEDRRSDRYNDTRGLDGAVELCMSEIERDRRVDRVDEVERDGSGWEVSGRLYDGSEFECRIGSDGRIDRIEYEGRDSGERYDDDRYGDDRYEISDDGSPAYPGGPVPDVLASAD